MPAAPAKAPAKTAQQMLDEGAKILSGHLYPNMDDLPELSVGTVLANVEGLYSKAQSSLPMESKRNKIYSTVGPVLIAVNPFEKLDCFGPDWAEAFRSEGAARSIDTAWQRLGPHCFGTMEQVYQALSKHPKQAVVICGESGAGKTYTNKLMMEYLLKTDQAPIARVVTSEHGSPENSGGRDRSKTASSAASPPSRLTVRQGIDSPPSRLTVRQGIDMTQLASSNELLEAFGNAKTSRNNNSSRFGKFSKLFMGGEPLDVRGLEIDHYLLERSRVVSVPAGERNYHILHMLAHAENKNPSGGFFKYIPAGVPAPEDMDDEDGFESLQITMQQARFDQEQIEHIFNYITAVLYLGNIEFQERPKNPDASQVSGGMSDPSLSRASKLLGIDPARFGEALTKKILKTRSEGDIEMDVNVDEANEQRDAVAKMLYSRIFDWIIKIMNNKLAASQRGSSKPTACVGLLDIFGFEDMPINGFEQMFINLTNEKIQQLFNKIMIERELQVYAEEGIGSSYEPPPGNGRCLDLFLLEKPLGMVAAIANRIKEAGKEFDKMDGAPFVRQLNKNFKQQKQDFYVECTPSMVSEVMRQKKKRWGKDIRLAWEECFQVKHYAGTVTYELKGFLQKSTDSIEDHIFNILVNSDQDDVRALVATPDQLSGSDKRLTVGEKFKIQLKTLSQELESSNSIFVRCIKPTPKLKPKFFDPELVLEQLKCGGVVSALEMRAASLPDRLTYNEFIEDFWVLETGEYRTERGRKAGRELQRCEEILKTFSRQVLVDKDGSKEDAWILEWSVDGTRVVKYDKPGKDGKLVVEKGVDASRIKKEFALGTTKVFLKTGVLARLRLCLRLKRSFAAILLQYAWLAFKGKRLVADMERLQKDLSAKVEAAEHYGFTSIAYLQKAISQADKCVSENIQRIEAYKESQPQLKVVQANAWPREAGVKIMQDVVKPEELKRMKKLVKVAIEAVDDVSKRRTYAESLVDELLGRNKKEVDEWLSYLDDLDETCQGTTTQEAECMQHSGRAREHLDRLMIQELPAIQKKLLRELDYSMDIIPESVKTPPELATLMTESDLLIARVKDAGQSLVEKRRRFQLETLQAKPEVQQMMQERESMRARLKQLEVEASQEFFYEVNEAIAKALQLDTRCDELWRQAKSPEAYVEGLQRYLQAGEVALESMKMAAKQKLEEMEHQRQLHQDAMSCLEQHEELKQAAQKFRRMLEHAHLQMMGAEGDEEVEGDATEDAARTAMLRRKTLQPVWSSIKEKVSGALTAVEILDLQVNDDDVDDSIGRFVADGPWNIECFQRLGSNMNLDELKGHVKVFGPEVFDSVLAAVQALNVGNAVAEEGFCVGWSATLESYFLLYQAEKQSEAYAAVGGSPSTFFGKGSRMKDVVRKVCDTVNLKELAEAARKHDEDLVLQLRTEMQGQIDELSQRCEEAERAVQDARASELEHLEESNKSRSEIQNLKVALKAAQQEMKTQSKQCESVKQHKESAEQHAQRKEMNLKQELREAHEVIEQQRLQIRKAQRENVGQNLRADIGTAFHEGNAKLAMLQTQVAQGYEQLRSDVRERMEQDRADLAAAPADGMVCCRGNCVEARTAEVRLREAQSTCTRLEVALLEKQKDFVAHKRDLHDQMMEKGRELEQLLRGEICNVRVQVQEMAKTMQQDMAVAQKDLADALTVEQATESQRLQKDLVMERARNEKLQKDYHSLKEELKAALEGSSDPGPALSSVLARCEQLQEGLNDSEKALLQERLNQRERELECLQGVTAKLAEVQQRLEHAESRGENAMQELSKRESHEQEAARLSKALLELQTQIQLRDDLSALRKERDSLEGDMKQLRQDLALSEASRKAAAQKVGAIEPVNMNQDHRRHTVKNLLNRSDSPEVGAPVTSKMLQELSTLKTELEDERERCRMIDRDLTTANSQLFEARAALAILQAAGNGNSGVDGGAIAGEADRNTATVSVGGHAIAARASAYLNPEEQSFWHRFSSAIHTQKVLWCSSKGASHELGDGSGPPRRWQEGGVRPHVTINGAD